MTVYFNRHRERWCYDFQRGGRRYQDYCDHPETGIHAANKTEAKRIEALAIADVERAIDARKAGRAATPAPVQFTLVMAIDEYLARADAENRSAFNNEDYAAELLAWFGPARLLSDITLADIQDYTRWCQLQTVKIYMGGPRKRAGRPPQALFRDSGRLRSPGTVNKYLLALEAAWKGSYTRHLARFPKFPACPEIAYLQTKKHLPNPVRLEDVERLVKAAAHHLLVTIVLAIHTSMRLREILLLEWPEVRLDLGIITLKPRTKNQAGRVVYLTQVAIAVLSFLYDHRPAGQDRVVLYWARGYGQGTPRPISSVASAWRSALAAAEISTHYRFHDLRGVIGTFLARDVDPLTLQKWLGHAELETTMRYVALADAAQIEAARLADRYEGTKGAAERIATPAPGPSTTAAARDFIGVYPAGRTRYEARFVLSVRENGKTKKRAIYLGCYPDPVAAARAYDAEASKYPGRRLNFPNVLPLAGDGVPYEESLTDDRKASASGGQR